MTMWSDNRNHLLDDLLRDSLLVLLAQLIGVGARAVRGHRRHHPAERKPAARQPAAVVRRGSASACGSARAFTACITASASATRAANGPVIVQGRSPALGGHNFGVLFPWWDMLFRTSELRAALRPHGRARPGRDRARDYGRGFWSQQWLGLKRLFGKGLTRPARVRCAISSGARLTLFLDSFWRAVAYCLHPRVIALSFLPLAVMVALSLGLGYFYWDAALDWVRGLLESSDLLKSVWALAAGRGCRQPQDGAWRR